jgi:hypothetical protein
MSNRSIATTSKRVVKEKDTRSIKDLMNLSMKEISHDRERMEKVAKTTTTKKNKS